MRRILLWLLLLAALLPGGAGRAFALALLQTPPGAPDAVGGFAPPTDPRDPVFTWLPAANALTYELRVQPVGGEPFVQTFTQGSVCDAAACAAALSSPLPAATYLAWVRAANPTGAGVWSAPLRFRMAITPPRPLSPVGETASAEAFIWEAVPGALWYQIQVEIAPNVTYDRWYDQFGICEGTTCTGALEIALGAGQYRWQVRSFVLTQGDNLYSEWSDLLDFAIAAS
ncbi:MAG: hypothetical protein JNL42_14440 [Anaerolineae bacterium]|nr:hypothetical protein [Anaerolineae bacterium]